MRARPPGNTRNGIDDPEGDRHQEDEHHHRDQHLDEGKAPLVPGKARNPRGQRVHEPLLAIQTLTIRWSRGAETRFMMMLSVARFELIDCSPAAAGTPLFSWSTTAAV